MEKINKAQAFTNQEKTPSYMLAKKTLELNPSHPVMKKMLNELKENEGELSMASTEYADLLFQMAVLNSGFAVENPMDLTEPLERLIKVGFGLARDEPCEEIEIELDDDEEEEGQDGEDGEADEGTEEIDLSSLDADAEAETEAEEHEVVTEEL
jgi:hypothetical protein|mmetsp:Transcript_39184/g.51259  ORF Transcript_39184/g.51259 Transcript_39184/m.51259 type:complete len:154 (+) Transcript_39184:2210-2671(+)